MFVVYIKNSEKREYPICGPELNFFFRGICPVPCVLCQCTVVFAFKCRLFPLCAHGPCRMYIIFILWNSISGLEAWYHFRSNISRGVAVTVRSHQEKFQVIFQGDGRGAKKNWRGGPIFKAISLFEVFFIFYVVFIFEVVHFLGCFLFEVIIIFEVSSFLRSSSYLRLSSFLSSSSYHFI